MQKIKPKYLTIIGLVLLGIAISAFRIHTKCPSGRLYLIDIEGNLMAREDCGEITTIREPGDKNNYFIDYIVPISLDGKYGLVISEYGQGKGAAGQAANTGILFRVGAEELSISEIVYGVWSPAIEYIAVVTQSGLSIIDLENF